MNELYRETPSYPLSLRDRGMKKGAQHAVPLLRGSIVFRDDRHFAIWLFACALRLHIRVIAQRNMDDAALAGRHRLERLAPSILGNLLSHAFGHLD